MGISYCHVQKGRIHLLLAAVALILVGAALASQAGAASLALLVAAAVVGVLTFCFQTLTVSDQGDHLLVQFGPIPWFGKRIPYSIIQTVERSRSSFIDGWGIHWMPGRGWIWNLEGFDCARLMVDGKPTRIGTDDADALVAFLQTRVQAAG